MGGAAEIHAALLRVCRSRGRLSEVVVDEAAKSAVLGDPAHRSLI